jgi:hypothetical protein
MTDCKHENRLYLGGNFVWCLTCGALHRVIDVSDNGDESTLIGDWVHPGQEMSVEKVIAITQMSFAPEMEQAFENVIPMSKLLN